MKFSLLCLALFTLAVISHPFGAHQSPCDHDNIMEKLFQEHPDMKEEMQELHSQMRDAAREYMDTHFRHGSKQTLEVIRIPVVWHVLRHSSAPETMEVTEAKIIDEMAWINEWYSATNTYYNTGSSYWSNSIAVASELQIEFVLASTDPNGQPTTGINFKTTTVANTCVNSQIQLDSSGGVDAWDTLNYMNIWVCKINTGSAGYAYLPSTSTYTHYRDGIVFSSEYVGSSYISGSILAHEAGHWLGLPHTFSGNGACDYSDGVPDTPTSDTNGFNYVSGNAACPGNGGMTDQNFIRCGNVVMIQNCMDYNYEHCKAFFSKGQAALMRSFLENPGTARGVLRNSPGLSGGCTADCSNKNCGGDGCGGSCGSCGTGQTCNSGVCQCVPNCSGKTCGDNGCGGSCGSCGAGQTCNGSGNCQCSPNCSGKNCGDNGCGGSCGSCGAGDICSNTGVCECLPACANRDCGGDGCGGSCGTCAVTQECNASGDCVCVPDCAGKSCGSDGCGGSCGSCGGNQACSSGTCVNTCTPNCSGKDCGDDGCGGSCGTCNNGQACDNAGSCQCVPNCSGKTCGSNGCGGTCGSCPADQTCDTALGTCQCVPNCSGKNCGDNGCGGSCGSCSGSESCNNGVCACQPNCAGKECGNDGCGGVCGTCNANSETCNASDICECVPNCSGKTCGDNGCGGSCGSCSGTDTCTNGTCGCSPSCGTNECGSDGCGGSCGSCGAGETCASGACQCTPNCSGLSCGDDGCGGSCGSCSSGFTCNAIGACVNPAAIDAFRAQIIADHNNARSNVIPSPAEPLTGLTYSSSLEADAQTWADTCTYGHSGNGNGENIYYVTGDQTGNLVSLANNADTSWESEKAFYTLTEAGGVCDSGKVCGHYTQMVWDHPTYPTTEVGCAYKHCTQNGPWGTAYGGLWTMVVCNYGGPGNYVGLNPYTVCTSNCNAGCSDTCPDDVCGEYVTDCGEVLDCGECCDDPCDIHDCGSHQYVGCNNPNYVSCGNCAAGSSCIASANGNVCEVDAVCNHADECLSGGFQCGNKNFCGATQVCGFCSENEVCVDFQCVTNSCGGNCGANSECVNGACECFAGFVPGNNGVCVAPSLTDDFVQTFPSSPISFTLPDSRLQLNAQGPHILKWISSASVVDLYTTEVSVEVQVDSGEFGLAIRHEQNTGSRVNDRIMWHVRNIGSSPQLAICLVYYGNSYCSPYSSFSFPTTATTARATMGFDGSNILTTFQVGGGSVWSSSVSNSYYPAIGSISYFLSPSGGDIPTLSESVLITSSTLTVSLAGCIDDSEWEQMFFSMTGANPATTSVQVRGSGQNGNCGKSASGKVLVSGFTTVVSSSSVPAAALASTLVNSVGGPAAATFGVSSASIVGGAAGASAAGIPISVAALPGTVITAPGSAAAAGAAGAAGGAGGAAGGLSGGAIAGIVVGSVAGAVLLVGVTTLVVAAVIVGAIVLTSGDDDSAPADNTNKRKSVRKTLRGFFGGVDVMNDPGNGHQSITGRTPAM